LPIGLLGPPLSLQGQLNVLAPHPVCLPRAVERRRELAGEVLLPLNILGSLRPV